MELTTRRFVLRDFRPEDEPQLRAYHADPAYRRFSDPQDAPDTAQLLRWFSEWAAEDPRRNFQVAVAARPEPERLVGCCGLRGKDAPPGEADFGIEIAPAYWGRHGYAVEITGAMLAFVFRDLGLRAVRASTVSANTIAARLAEHFGFERTGKTVAPDWMRERGWSEVTWRLTRERWNASPARRRGQGRSS